MALLYFDRCSIRLLAVHGITDRSFIIPPLAGIARSRGKIRSYLGSIPVEAGPGIAFKTNSYFSSAITIAWEMKPMPFALCRARIAASLTLVAVAVFGLRQFSGGASDVAQTGLNQGTVAARAGTAAIHQPDAATRSRAIDAYGRSPLRFEANHGQADAPVKFILRNSGYTLFLSAGEASINLRATKSAKQPATIRMKFVDANPGARIFGMEKMAGASNYFIGADPRRWRAGVENFGKVEQRAVWPGIDVVWHGAQRRLEYDFIVAPGADPRRIRLDFSGARGMSVDEDGALKLRTEAGDLRLLRPVAWQDSDGGREDVSCEYRINDANLVEFKLGEYDRGRELVIDPVITLATWFGGADVDEARKLAVDKDGSVVGGDGVDSANDLAVDTEALSFIPCWWMRRHRARFMSVQKEPPSRALTVVRPGRRHSSSGRKASLSG